MEKNELLNAMIKPAVESGLRYICDHPKRGIRNLVDLGEYFATEKSQKDFFDLVHKILNNENNSYYKIIENAVKNINHNKLTNFGINIGYNSFTYGAKILRENQEKYGYRVPWTITFNFKEPSSNLSVKEIVDFITDCKKIGIFSFIFRLKNNIEFVKSFCEIIEKFNDCAFVVSINPESLTDEVICRLKDYDNIAIFILSADNTNIANNQLLIKKVNQLYSNKCLFGICKYYDDEYSKNILNNEYVKDLLNTKCFLSILIKGEKCSQETVDRVYDYIVNSRIKSNYPVFLIDLYRDIEVVGNSISNKGCILKINGRGDVTSFGDIDLNIKKNSIEQILLSNKNN